MSFPLFFLTKFALPSRCFSTHGSRLLTHGGSATGRTSFLIIDTLFLTFLSINLLICPIFWSLHFFLSIIPNHSTWPLTLCLFVFISACQLLSIIFRKSWVIHPKVLKWMSGVDWGAKTFVDDTHLNTGTNKLSSSSIFLWKIGNKQDHRRWRYHRRLSVYQSPYF